MPLYEDCADNNNLAEEEYASIENEKKRVWQSTQRHPRSVASRGKRTRSAGTANLGINSAHNDNGLLSSFLSLKTSYVSWHLTGLPVYRFHPHRRVNKSFSIAEKLNPLKIPDRSSAIVFKLCSL